ncbi:MAG: hypothetical protein WKG07_46140 [Hymenobacter sp.]
MTPTPVTRTPEWNALLQHRRQIGWTDVRKLFEEDPTRGESLTAEAGDLFLDYSKNMVTAETIALLAGLAGRAGLRQRIDDMFAGRHINVTEDRAVLHVALRMPRDTSLVVDGQDVVADVHRVLDRMAALLRRRAVRRMDRYHRENHRQERVITADSDRVDGGLFADDLVGTRAEARPHVLILVKPGAQVVDDLLVGFEVRRWNMPPHRVDLFPREAGGEGNRRVHLPLEQLAPAGGRDENRELADGAAATRF